MSKTLGRPGDLLLVGWGSPEKWGELKGSRGAHGGDDWHQPLSFCHPEPWK